MLACLESCIQPAELTGTAELRRENGAIDSHGECINRWQGSAFGPCERLPENRFHLWAANDRLVAKIYKPCEEEIDGARLVDHARAKFVRATMFAPSIHLRWESIPCGVHHGKACSAAIIMPASLGKPVGLRDRARGRKRAVAFG